MASNEDKSNCSRFHQKYGQLVVLSESGTTASRSHANQEFNHGLIMSSSPLQDDRIFEVRIDKKINSWSGSIEVGVVACDPDEMELPLPSSATELRCGAWVLSGNSILKDGRSIQENYGSTDLDKLEENDRVGVLKTSQGDLVFYVNGVSQSVAATGLPEKVWAIVDLYGKCAQVTLMDDALSQEARILSNELSNEATAAASNKNLVNLISSGNSAHHNLTNSNIAAMSSGDGVNSSTLQNIVQDFSATSPVSSQGSHTNGVSLSSNKLRFNERKGKMIKLSNNHRTAERRRPYDEFNNGVVMTHRTLEDDELFEVRIDRLVEKWSGSIEVGITTHNPDLVELPATMTNLKSGTMMMSGSGILTNGKGTRRDYGDFNLDELQEGDRIGLMRKSNGDLHFYVNGLDQGVAATRVPAQIWGAVDVYGMTVRVTIVDRDERDEQNLITRRAVGMRDVFVDENRLTFHPNCGSHAAVMNGGLTAHRPNAADDFNFGVVLTSRPLKPNEIFEVRLDKMVSKWAGSIEIGLTTHSPNELEFPSTMTNIRSGTWMMTGNGVMHNGVTIIDDYGINLDKLKVGDRVAVVRKENGTIHFFVNSEDQGPAATKVPERVFGVIDLYGQAAQATIIDLSDYGSTVDALCDVDVTMTAATMAGSGFSDCRDLLRFHHLHGRNARISNNGLSATRPNALGEFNDAIVMSNRPLRDDEVFEIVIEQTVDRWSGSIEAGVTLIRPEDLDFPNTMTDIDYVTWMLSGSAVMRDGRTIRNGYCCDLDTLGVGSRLGMVRCSDGTLHYTINGEDQGVACHNIPPGVFAVIDLYGQCSAVSLVSPTSQSACSLAVPQISSQFQQLQQENNSLASSQIMESSHTSLPIIGPVVTSTCEILSHRFQGPSRNCDLKNNNTACTRHSHAVSALVFACHCFESTSDSEDTFEVRIDQVNQKFSGSLRLGITARSPGSVSESEYSTGMIGLGKDTIWIQGSAVKRNDEKCFGRTIRQNFCFSLDRLKSGDRVGIKFGSSDGTIKFYINGEDCGSVTIGPGKFYPVVELYGSTVAVSCVSSCHQFFGHARSQDSLFPVPPDDNNEVNNKTRGMGNDGSSSDNGVFSFHENRGRNIQLKNGSRSASRTDSYNQGLVFSNRPLTNKEPFEVTIVTLDPKWSSSIMIGVTLQNPDRIHPPVTSLSLKKGAYIIAGNSVYHNGSKILGHFIPDLDAVQVGQKVGVSIVHQDLHLHINGVDQGPVVQFPQSGSYYAVVDLYGQCTEVSLDESASPQKQEPVIIPCTEKVDNKKSNNSGSGLSKQCCEYFNLCQRFKSALVLPTSFFSSPPDVVCYCGSCCKMRGEELYKKKGDPPRDFATPQGWVKFPLKVSSRPGWHVAYHGTKLTFLRKILDHGQLLPVGELGLEQKLSKPKSKEDDSDAPQLLFSPTLKYVGGPEFSPPVSFKDKKTGRVYQGQVAFQIEVHPGSYKIGPPCGPLLQPDPHFKEDETVWLTKERGNTVITALLIQMLPVSSV